MKDKWHSKIFILSIIVIGIAIFFIQEARANVAMPTIVILWPGAWLLLLPVIVIEAVMARRMLQIAWKKALKVTAAANAVSTLLGIPIAWFLAAFLIWSISVIGILSKFPEWLHLILMNVLWLPLVENAQEWFIPLSTLILCIPFFFASVWIEGKIAGRMLKDLKAQDIRSWIWRANLYSYGFIGILLLGNIAWILIRR